ncbi:MAG: hypothetical protein NVV73_12345 [Cellvibrionaceae bacterium]|nr:hypothetical protein [Cellvibrionaceae bacterium]
MMASFDTVPAAGECVAAIIADGVVPAAKMEFMDRRAAEAIEAYNQPGYPRGAEGILIIDADGVAADVTWTVQRVTEIVAQCGAALSPDCHRRETARPHLVGPAARPPSLRRWGGCRPTMICMDGSIPAMPCRR